MVFCWLLMSGAFVADYGFRCALCHETMQSCRGLGEEEKTRPS